MNLESMIDHTLLDPKATSEEIEKLCKEAMEYNFKAVCVNPQYVSLAKSVLEGSDVSIATVVGFPLGANTKEVKAFESQDAIENGANEIDMVINIGALKSKNYDLVEEDIRAVVDKARGKAKVKVIIETCLLSDLEKEKACKLAMKADADFVKTSTGFSTAGASVKDIKLMKSIVGDKLGIKASGGIRDRETALKMVEAGATRLGASAGIKIVQ